MGSYRTSNCKSHPLDLSKRGNDLEGSFHTYINKIPDLLLPPTVRLQGEDDFFNVTKSIKTRPFRKQEVFERCISPELIKKSDDHGYILKPIRVSLTKNKIKNEHETRHIDVSNTDENKSTGRSTGEGTNAFDEEGNVAKIGYGRLFTRPFEPDYPFSNPMPASMMTDQNIDNLRDIIVSSCDIEWKMLTPIRPENDYEERYFSRLIELHRLRYKSRLEAGYFGPQRKRIPFRHSRHPYVVHHFRPRRNHTASISLGVKLKSRFRTRDERAKSIGLLKLQIPKVTLTSDERSASEKLVSSGDDDLNCEDMEQFDYNYFSRYSRRNQLRQERLRQHQQQRQQQKQQHKLTNVHSSKTSRRARVKSARSSESLLNLLNNESIPNSNNIDGNKNNNNEHTNYDEQMNSIVDRLLATNL